MNRSFLTSVGAAALLAGCAAIGTPSPTAQLDATRAFVIAESGFDAAVVTADVAIDTGSLSAATVTRIKALTDTGHTYVVAGRAAVTAADSTSLLAETTALTSLVSQIAALSKG